MTTATATVTAIAVHPALPKLSAGLALAARALCGRSFELRIGSAETLCVNFEEAPTGDAAFELCVRCAGHDYELQVTQAATLLGQTPVLDDNAPEGLRRAMLLHNTQPLWDALEALFGSPIELLSLAGRSPRWSANEALCARVVRSDAAQPRCQAGALLLRPCLPQGWPVLMRAANALQPGTPTLAAWPIEVAVRCEPLALSLDELQGLEIGDVLLLDAGSARYSGTPVRLAISDRVLQGVRGLLQGPRLRLTQVGARTPPLTSPHRRPAMNATASPPTASDTSTPAPTKPPAAFDQRGSAGGLEAALIDVHVELARLTLPLSTVRELAVGQVFDTLHGIDSGSLVLWCGGQRLGLGQLVAVGERIGVRLVALEGAPAVAPRALPTVATTA